MNRKTEKEERIKERVIVSSFFIEKGEWMNEYMNEGDRADVVCT